MQTYGSTNQIAAQEAIALMDALKLHHIAEQAKAALRRRSAQLGRPELADAVVAQMVADMDKEEAS